MRIIVRVVGCRYGQIDLRAHTMPIRNRRRRRRRWCGHRTNRQERQTETITQPNVPIQKTITKKEINQHLRDSSNCRLLAGQRVCVWVPGPLIDALTFLVRVQRFYFPFSHLFHLRMHIMLPIAVFYYCKIRNCQNDKPDQSACT